LNDEGKGFRKWELKSRENPNVRRYTATVAAEETTQKID